MKIEKLVREKKFEYEWFIDSDKMNGRFSDSLDYNSNSLFCCSGHNSGEI